MQFLAIFLERKVPTNHTSGKLSVCESRVKIGFGIDAQQAKCEKVFALLDAGTPVKTIADTLRVTKCTVFNLKKAKNDDRGMVPGPTLRPGCSVSSRRTLPPSGRPTSGCHSPRI